MPHFTIRKVILYALLFVVLWEHIATVNEWTVSPTTLGRPVKDFIISAWETVFHWLATTSIFVYDHVRPLWDFIWRFLNLEVFFRSCARIALLLWDSTVGGPLAGLATYVSDLYTTGHPWAVWSLTAALLLVVVWLVGYHLKYDIRTLISRRPSRREPAAADPIPRPASPPPAYRHVGRSPVRKNAQKPDE